MKTVILISQEKFGCGDEELGKKLIGSFLRKVSANAIKPATIIFYHKAVKLLNQQSPVLDAIERLSQEGVDLVACGTCAGYYDIRDDIQLGRVSDMTEIVRLLMNADKVITP